MRPFILFLVFGLLTGCASSHGQAKLPSPPPEPVFIRNIPQDHYLGSAWNVPRIDQARNKAIQDAIRQISQAFGMVVKVEYRETVVGGGRVVSRAIKEEFSIVSEALLSEIPQHIVRTAFQPLGRNRYNAYVLVNFPRKKLEQLRVRYASEQAVRQRIRAEERGRFRRDLNLLQKNYEEQAKATGREVRRLRELIATKLRKKGYVDYAVDWLRELWTKTVE